MHELPVTESLLEIALRHADKSGAVNILALNIVIGQFASVIDDSIQFYWEIIASGTPAELATLNFRRLPAEYCCQDCSTSYQPGTELACCPQCSSANIKLTQGQEFYLESIEVE